MKDERRVEELENALEDLAKTVRDNLGGICKISVLDIKNKEVLVK